MLILTKMGHSASPTIKTGAIFCSIPVPIFKFVPMATTESPSSPPSMCAPNNNNYNNNANNNCSLAPILDGDDAEQSCLFVAKYIGLLSLLSLSYYYNIQYDIVSLNE